MEKGRLDTVKNLSAGAATTLAAQRYDRNRHRAVAELKPVMCSMRSSVRRRWAGRMTMESIVSIDTHETRAEDTSELGRSG